MQALLCFDSLYRARDQEPLRWKVAQARTTATVLTNQQQSRRAHTQSAKPGKHLTRQAEQAVVVFPHMAHWPGQSHCTADRRLRPA